MNRRAARAKLSVEPLEDRTLLASPPIVLAAEIGADHQVYYELLDPAGSPTTGRTLVAPGQFLNIAAVSYGTGGAADLFGVGLDHQVYGARFNAQGQLLSGWFRVAPGYFESLAVTTSGPDGAPLLFGLATAAGRHQVYAAKFNAEGHLVAGWYPVAPGMFRSIAAGQLGTDGNPEVFGVGINNEVYGARLTSSGDLANGWFRIAPGAFDRLMVDEHDDGTLELLGLGTNADLYGAQVGTSGHLEYGWYSLASCAAVGCNPFDTADGRRAQTPIGAPDPGDGGDQEDDTAFPAIIPAASPYQFEFGQEMNRIKEGQWVSFSVSGGIGHSAFKVHIVYDGEIVYSAGNAETNEEGRGTVRFQVPYNLLKRGHTEDGIEIWLEHGDVKNVTRLTLVEGIRTGVPDQIQEGKTFLAHVRNAPGETRVIVRIHYDAGSGHEFGFLETDGSGNLNANLLMPKLITNGAPSDGIEIEIWVSDHSDFYRATLTKGEPQSRKPAPLKPVNPPPKPLVNVFTQDERVVLASFVTTPKWAPHGSGWTYAGALDALVPTGTSQSSQELYSLSRSLLGTATDAEAKTIVDSTTKAPEPSVWQRITSVVKARWNTIASEIPVSVQYFNVKEGTDGRAVISFLSGTPLEIHVPARFDDDGASIPKWLGILGNEYKLYLDSKFPEFFRLHDHLYSTQAIPFGLSRLQADVILYLSLAPREPSALIIFRFVRLFGSLHYDGAK